MSDTYYVDARSAAPGERHQSLDAAASGERHGSASVQPASGLTSTTPRPPQRAKASRRFRASVGRFDDQDTRTKIDALAQWVEDYYREDLRQRHSKHVYLRTLPADVLAQIDRLRDSPEIRSAILEQFEPGSAITPMKHTDELYISHYNKDYGGDHGLFSKHYDGNLRFLPFTSVVRALIYLQSDSTYKVVFGDSQVSQAFVTYEFGLLDFHRELHWVEGEYNPSDVQRILLKCNYFVSRSNAGLWERAVLGMNTTVFYVVKAAMEYSKSPKNPLQRGVGWLCNLFRLMNNVHPLVPFALIGLVLALLAWGVVRLVT